MLYPFQVKAACCFAHVVALSCMFCKCCLQAFVWVAEHNEEGTSQLKAFNGATGAVVYSGGNLGATAEFITPIISQGRLYVTTSNALLSFAVQGAPAVAPSPSALPATAG